MTMGEMMAWTKRLKEITESEDSSDVKDQRLANMMTDLEVAYRIPALRNETFEKQNPHVMQLYRTVSESRVMG